jgi:hypothetical protein
VPIDVANISDWTWMCAPSPVDPSSVSRLELASQPNIHPNEAGCAVIARTFEGLLRDQRWS